MGSVSSTPIPAATVVLLRPGRDGLEALLTRRPTTMTFAPDVHVFPGGRVDDGDADPGLLTRSVISLAEAALALGGELEPVAALAAHIAAIREAFEEVGILLADAPTTADVPGARRRLLSQPDSFPAIAAELGLRLRTDLLIPLSRWVTPPTLDRRFDARFFAAQVPPDADADLIGQEVVDHGWHRPADALALMALGTFAMWLPTAMTLAQLEHAASIDAIRDRLAPGRPGAVAVESIADDIVRIEMPAGGGVAGQPINAYLVGRRRHVLVDPGDPTGPGLERAMAEAAARGGRIAAIAITGADPDHVGGAEALREQLGVDIVTGPGGGRWLPHVVREVGDGDVIDDGDVPLAVVATPGQRPDALAFVVGEGQFAVTGDLDGRRGARSIPGPVDEAEVRRSVARLAGRAPSARWLGAHPGPVDTRR
jgi:glyoxylase-like metal-dependent hydrolase (beta-lactamase superfamily II)/8-oxo-dGTP pyrophosphatase MutT (NUDIX family)